MSFTQSIPFTGTHSSIIIGKKGATIKNLQHDSISINIRNILLEHLVFEDDNDKSLLDCLAQEIINIYSKSNNKSVSS